MYFSKMLNSKFFKMLTSFDDSEVVISILKSLYLRGGGKHVYNPLYQTKI